MYFKCLDEEGHYRDINGTPKNLLVAEYTAYTPEGPNIDWVYLESEDEAISFFGLIPVTNVLEV